MQWYADRRFTADGQDDGNTCASTDSSQSSASLATWTKLTSTTAPTQVLSDEIFNEAFGNDFGDGNWEEK